MTTRCKADQDSPQAAIVQNPLADRAVQGSAARWWSRRWSSELLG